MGGFTVAPDAFPVDAGPAGRAREVLSVGGGVNRRLNCNLKFSFNHEYTRFLADAGTLYADQHEDLVLMRGQVAF